MKKILALVLALMFLSVSFACAQNVKVPYEPAWIQFEEGFQFALPSDWLEMELNDAQKDAGVFYAACNPGQTNIMQAVWAALDEPATIEEVRAEMVVDYPDAEIATFNGIDLLGYTDTANDSLVIIATDAAQPGLYLFIFTPADDAAFTQTALSIASTISNY